MSPPALVLIAAVARNGAIGRGGGLPWRLAGDMRHFRERTMGKPLILGRATWQSIGRALPGRRLVIVSSDPNLAVPPDAVVCPSPDEAVMAARSIAAALGAAAVMVGGGATIYAGLIDRADRLDITHVDLAPEADAFFPPIDPAVWRLSAERAQPRAAGEDAAFAFTTYERIDRL